MTERVFANIPTRDVPSFRSMLEADGFTVTEVQQPDGNVTLRARSATPSSKEDWSADFDIRPEEPWPKPGKG
jgi:hypothetical protein